MWFKRQSNGKIMEDNGSFDAKSNQKLRDYQVDLECEEAIIKDKERFGRVSTIRMRYIREKYGQKIANKALARIQKRYKNNKHTSKIMFNSTKRDETNFV